MVSSTTGGHVNVQVPCYHWRPGGLPQYVQPEEVILVSVVHADTVGYVDVSNLYCHVEVHGSFASRDHVDVHTHYH